METIRLRSTDTPRRFKITSEALRFDILGDSRIIKQAILNILSNADKFTPHDGEIAVHVGLSSDGAVFVQISDDGEGIDAHEVAGVLEPFGQARSNSQVAHEGTGLGLPLSQKFMELHGGTLTLESQRGEGTTVKLTFPVERSMAGG